MDPIIQTVERPILGGIRVHGLGRQRILLLRGSIAIRLVTFSGKR